MTRLIWKSTIMDQNGRVFFPEVLRRRLGLLEGGLIAFVTKEDGSVIIRKAMSPKKKPVLRA